MPLDCGLPDPALVNYATFSCPEGTSFLQRCSISCVPPAKLQGIVSQPGLMCRVPSVLLSLGVLWGSSLHPNPLPICSALSLSTLPCAPILFLSALLDQPLLITPAKSPKATSLFPMPWKDHWLRISLQRETKAFFYFHSIVCPLESSQPAVSW